MKVKTIKMTYEPESDVLSWEANKQAIDYAEEFDNVVVHFSKKNVPVLMEILEASKFLSKAKKLVGSQSQLVKS